MLHRGTYHFYTAQNQTNVNRKIHTSAFMAKLLVKQKKENNKHKILNDGFSC